MYDPCIDDEVETYLNRPDVQLAMHANTSRHRLPYRWTQCAGAPLNYSQCVSGPNSPDQARLSVGK